MSNIYIGGKSALGSCCSKKPKQTSMSCAACAVGALVQRQLALRFICL